MEDSDDEHSAPPARPPPKPPITQDSNVNTTELSKTPPHKHSNPSEPSHANVTEETEISHPHDSTNRDNNNVHNVLIKSTSALLDGNSSENSDSSTDDHPSLRSESAPEPCSTSTQPEEQPNRKTAPGAFIKILPRSRRPPPLIIETKVHGQQPVAVGSTRVCLVISNRKSGFSSGDEDSFLLDSVGKEGEKRQSLPLERKQDWIARCMRSNPEIQELKERLYPLDRTIAFGSHCIQKKTQEFSKEQILTLIAQYLHCEGLKNSRIILEEAAGLKVPSDVYDVQESRLSTIIRIAMKDVNQIFDSTIADRCQDDDENYGEVLEHLYDLGILEQTTSANDVNIWQEPRFGSIILDANGGLKAATLNQLVVHLTTQQDQEFLKAFLMTYQIFTTPEMLLSKLIQRYKPPVSTNVADLKDFKSIQIRVGIVLLKFMEEYLQENDFSDQLLSSVKMFLERHIKKDSASMYHKIDSAITRKMKGIEMPKVSLVLNSITMEPKVSISTIFQPNLSILDIDDLEIARQLCLMEYQIFSKIKSTELLNQAWMKPKLKHKSPNVLGCFVRSNALSTWICSLILKEEKLKDRVKVFTKVVRIAEHLRKLNNFSNLMSILGALNSNPIYRLHFTRDESSKQVLTLLDNLMESMSSASGFKAVRESVAQAKGPCIPYLGVYLTDLVFIDEGNQNFMSVHGKELINFHKFKLIYQQIDNIRRFQTKPYNLHPVHQIQSLLTVAALQKASLSQEELWELSMLREPKDAQSVP